ncbi:MAG: hypothetical protein JW904_05040 [Spirochaetales bacterium]|nr:hypothetical protein [Spirochaetales bacterium]
MSNIGTQTFIVARDGTGTHTSVTSALEAVLRHAAEPVNIYIKNGIYNEVVTVPDTLKNIHFIGEDPKKTIITGDNYNAKLKPDGSPYGTHGSATVFIFGDGFFAENITFQNDSQTGLQDQGRQAVALRSSADRLIFRHCRFLGNQDTLFSEKGRQYFENCYIEGDVDFIFGNGPVWFEQCEIKSVERHVDLPGFCCAPSTPASQQYGMVFNRCRCTAEYGVKDRTVYLGRGWHPTYYSVPVSSNAVFMHCELGRHIKKEGWTVMREQYPVPTERFREYLNSGAGAGKRHEHRVQLSGPEAEQYTIRNVLGGDDGWDPVKK